LTGGILQHGGAARELVADFGGAFEGEQRVSIGVIADDVAGVENLADDFGALLSVAADQEKSGVHAMSGEDIQ
jgi:hypothetical protein